MSWSLVVSSWLKQSHLMCFAAVSRIVTYGRPSANLATCGYRENARLGVVVLSDMFLAHIVGREDGYEWRRRRGSLNPRASESFLPLNQAHDADDFESKLPGCLDCLDGGGSGRADIVHDYDACPFLAETFNALASTM